MAPWLALAAAWESCCSELQLFQGLPNVKSRFPNLHSPNLAFTENCSLIWGHHLCFKGLELRDIVLKMILVKKLGIWPGWWWQHMPVIPALGGQREADLYVHGQPDLQSWVPGQPVLQSEMLSHTKQNRREGKEKGKKASIVTALSSSPITV